MTIRPGHARPSPRQSISPGKEGARLVAVAVEEHLPRYDGATLGEVRDEHEREQRDCRRWLRTAEAYAHEYGVRVRTEIRIGSLTRQLASAASAHQADLVVVGRTSHPRIWRWLVGTRTDRVSRRAGCSVLIASSPGRLGT